MEPASGNKPGEIELLSRGVLIEESRVLLCQNVARGYFYLPGGHVEHGESMREAVRREFLEEAGLPIDVGRWAGGLEQIFHQDGRTRHELTMLFHVKRDGTSPVQSLEPHIVFEWYAINELATLDVRPRSILACLGPTATRLIFIEDEVGA